MCITNGPAELSQTIIYAGEAIKDGKFVHILGYQNSVANMTSGPNAMLLPFPTNVSMGPENVLDTSECKSVLKDMAKCFENHRRRRSLSLSKSYDSLDDVQVFDSGNYTVVLTDDASKIPGALDRVREDRRPQVNQKLFDKLSEYYGEWPVALCCFNNKDKVAADPMMWWYEPIDTKTLFAPGLDSHTGGPPNLNEKVYVDHTIMFGSAIGSALMSAGASDIRGIKNELPESIKNIIPTSIHGLKYNEMMVNGDFIIKKASLYNMKDLSELGSIVERVQPKAA